MPKRWLLDIPDLKLPPFSGKYIEPFLGGGAVFFRLRPEAAVLSDVNKRLIETYRAVKFDWRRVVEGLSEKQVLHSRDYYYEERAANYDDLFDRAVQFLYLNRTCWNGLYRENLAGKFNVPIGTKTRVTLPDDDFEQTSKILQNASLLVGDFELTIARACAGDLVFIDPPYTTAHNKNGFVKYNQKIFSWDDQIRLKQSISEAIERGANVVLTNADHETIRELYAEFDDPRTVSRNSVISGKASVRGVTTELLYIF